MPPIHISILISQMKTITATQLFCHTKKRPQEKRQKNIASSSKAITALQVWIHCKSLLLCARTLLSNPVNAKGTLTSSNMPAAHTYKIIKNSFAPHWSG